MEYGKQVERIKRANQYVHPYSPEEDRLGKSLVEKGFILKDVAKHLGRSFYSVCSRNSRVWHPKAKQVSKEFQPMKIEDKAWLACAIDGEGTITVYLGGALVIRVSVWNTNYDFVEKAQTLAHVGCIRFRKRGERWKKCYEWSTGSLDEVIHVLTEVFPYLIIKKDLAKLVLELALYHKARLPEIYRRRSLRINGQRIKGVLVNSDESAMLKMIGEVKYCLYRK
jgi:hypothetical protein